MEPSPASDFVDLRRFFAPRGVALIGATEDLSKFGGRCMKQLLDFGYQGGVFAVNPRRSAVFGHRCYATSADLPQVPDHVGIVLPAAAVPAALADCSRIGVPFTTVFSSGFGGTGATEGRALQRRAVAVAGTGSTRFMGPNCNGLINFVDRFALTSTAAIHGLRRPAGDTAVISQSGGVGQVNTMWRAQEAGLGIRYQVSCGNDADLDLLDYVNFAVEDAGTRVVLVLAEHIADGNRLRQVAGRAAALRKPIVMIEFGRTEAGSRAAVSHTGAVTGTDAIFDAAARQLGILRVDDCPELYEAAMLLRRGVLPRGKHVAALSISGGNLVLLAEIGASLGLEFPAYAEGTAARLARLLPGFTGTRNPTDLSAAAIGVAGLFGQVARTVLGDPGIDALVPVITFAPAADIRAAAALAAAAEKPVPLLWTGKCSDDASLTPEALVAEDQAVYRDAGPCLRALAAATRYRDFLRRAAMPAPTRPDGLDAARAGVLLAGAAGTLSEAASKQLLACYGFRPPRESLASDAYEALAAAAEIGGPVALKVQSPDLPHKTEAGALRLNLEGPAAVRVGYEAVVADARAYAPAARIEGVLVQEMVAGGQETLLGMVRDGSFGPVLVVGFGGIHVEVLRDVAFRLPPVGPEDALDMLRELRSFPLLEGRRGAPPADLEALVDAIQRLSWLAQDCGDLLREIDVNPFVVLPRGHGARMVDALVVPN